MWSAVADPRVLSVIARATTAPDATDIRRFEPRVLPSANREHVRLIVHGEAFRLDVVLGTVISGPVHLTYLLTRGERLTRQIETIRRLELAFAGIDPGRVVGTSRVVRSAMALRACDARASGVSLREIAILLLGPGEWPGPGECRKSAVRRLVAFGEKLIRRGPLPILTW